MDSPAASGRRKKMMKQLTGKREDSHLHSAARAGNLSVVKEILTGSKDEELLELLIKQNQAGETALFVAAEYGYIDVVQEMIQYYDCTSAAIKAKNGYDALHVAAKQGDVEIVKELLNALPELSLTVDLSNNTALHTAATQGHIEVVNLLLEADKSLALIARSNGKTALHSAARNGHLEVVKALLEKEPRIATRTDKKGQTALHMAVKGVRLDLVEGLLEFEPALLSWADNKGNTALHIAARKGRSQILKRDFAKEEDNMDRRRLEVHDSSLIPSSSIKNYQRLSADGFLALTRALFTDAFSTHQSPLQLHPLIVLVT